MTTTSATYCHPTTERIEGGHPQQCGTCGDWYDLPCTCPDNNVRDETHKKHIVTVEVPEPAKGVKYLDGTEIFSLGLLFAINRTVLHPVGLAMEVGLSEEHPEVAVVRIWDDRDDPEGTRFEVSEELWTERMDAFMQLWEERTPARFDGLGYIVQMEPWTGEKSKRS